MLLWLLNLQSGGSYVPVGQFIEQVIFAAAASLFTNRLYPSVAPPNTVAPYAIQSVVSNVAENTLANGLVARKARIQIDTYDKTQYGARVLAQQLTTAMESLKSATMGVTLESEQVIFEGGTRLHRVLQEYSFVLPRAGGVS